MITFVLQPGGLPAYRVDYLGKPIILESRLGFEPGFTNGFAWVAASTNSHASQWSPVYGERRTIPDRYNQLEVDLRAPSGRAMRLSLRAFNEGAALRYTFPALSNAGPLVFAAERTEFRFPENTFGYEEHATEGEYRRSIIENIQPWCERPLTLEYASGLYASLTEAANEAYPRMLLSGLPGVPGALVSALGGPTSNTVRDGDPNGDWRATLAPGASTPWRLLVVGQKPGDLLERNYLVLNLNAPLALKDVSWLQPGKAMRDMTLTVTNSKAIIDFAAQAGLQFVHLDAGWYGTEDIDRGDATQPRMGGRWVRNLAQPVDLQAILRYGHEKNVGVWLYVDRRQIKKQRDVLFPLYQKWGVAGVKIGFVDVGPQAETAWITETIQQAAEHHLMLNIHDGYRPTGLERSYPNLMTVEGVRGNEHMPTPEHNCTLPFTRYVAGPADYTVCYYTPRKQTTFAHQLAMAVVSYSPVQWILWYDKPSDCRGEPEIEFFRQVPTVWDETKVLQGEIGKFASIARRSGEDWFIGTINNRETRRLKLPLTFLQPGKPYRAHGYSDDPSAPGRTHVAVATREVDAQTVLEVPLAPGGGQALWLARTPDGR